jgi:dGTPase
MQLAPYACDSAMSRGRLRFEAPAPTRTAFQRDRDRIVHSTSFRRLVYKTQVFVNHEGDLFRSRLTHSLEVAQLARSIARALRLNEDLVEAISLAHDLGHTPFGHAGQDALNGCLKALDPLGSGFEHNLQSLRTVDSLEQRYPAFDGLNLCFETREGILKHCSRRNALRIEAREPGGVAYRFVGSGELHAGFARQILDDAVDGLSPRQPSLEAQLANLADEIAYNAHDIDDGVRSGLLSLEQLGEVELFRTHCEAALAAHPTLTGRRLLYESIRLMLSSQVYDVIAATSVALERVRPGGVAEVRSNPPLVGFSQAMAVESAQLKHFLMRNLYRHPQVLETTGAAQEVVRDLFALYLGDAGLMTERPAPGLRTARAVADYIAAMTDRFASQAHCKLTGKTVFAASN